MSNLVRASTDYPGWDPNSIFSGADGNSSKVEVSGDVTGKINSLEIPAGSNISGWGATGWKRLAGNDDGNDEDSLEIAGHVPLDDDSLINASRDSLNPNDQWKLMANVNTNNNKDYMQQIMNNSTAPDDSIRDSLEASENWKKVAQSPHQNAPDDSIRDSLEASENWKKVAQNPHQSAPDDSLRDSLEASGNWKKVAQSPGANQIAPDDSIRDSLEASENWKKVAQGPGANQIAPDDSVRDSLEASENWKKVAQNPHQSAPDDSLRDSLEASGNWKKVAQNPHQIAPDDSIRDSLEASGNWKKVANPQSARNPSPSRVADQATSSMNNRMKQSYRNNNDDIEFDNRNASVIGIQRLFRGHIGRKQASRQQLYAERERLKSREKMKNELLKRIDLDPVVSADAADDNEIQILDDGVIMMKAHRKVLMEPIHVPAEQPTLNPVISPVSKVVDDVVYPANVLESDEGDITDTRYSPSKVSSPHDDSLDVDDNNSSFPVEVGIYIDNTGGKEDTAETSLSVKSINAEDISYINNNNHAPTTYFSIRKVPSVEVTVNKTPPKTGFSVKDLINLSPPAPLIENAKVRSPIISHEEQLPPIHVPSMALPELSPGEKAILNKQQHRQQPQVVQHAPTVSNNRALMQARRANAAITIQRVYRGHIARNLAKKRKAIWIHKYQCANCKRVEQGGAYCKGCGHKKNNQSTHVKTPRSYFNQYSNNPQNIAGGKIPRAVAAVSSVPTEPVVPVSRPPVVGHRPMNSHPTPAVEHVVPVHNPPPNRPRQMKPQPEKARMHDDNGVMENTLQMSAMERKLLMELEELDNIRQHNIELELQELDRQRIRIGNNNQDRPGRDERDSNGKKRAISEPPKSPRRVAAAQKRAPDVVKEKEKKAFGPGARDFRPPRPRPVEVPVKPSINHEEVQKQWEAAVAIDIHKPMVVEYRDPINNLGLPMKSPNAGIAEVVQGPSSYLREYHKRAHKPKKSNRDGGSVNTNDDDGSTAVSSYYAYSEAGIDKRRENNQVNMGNREETSSLPAISNRKTTSAPSRINSGVVKLPLIKA